MLIVELGADGPRNVVRVGGRSYVFARTAWGSFLLSTHCPHRGGPLQLGRVDDDRGVLVCPWHGRARSLRAVAGRALPAVRRDDVVTAVLPWDADTPWEVVHRPVSDDLRRGRDRAVAAPDTTGDGEMKRRDTRV